MVPLSKSEARKAREKKLNAAKQIAAEEIIITFAVAAEAARQIAYNHTEALELDVHARRGKWIVDSDTPLAIALDEHVDVEPPPHHLKAPLRAFLPRMPPEGEQLAAELLAADPRTAQNNIWHSPYGGWVKGGPFGIPIDMHAGVKLTPLLPPEPSQPTNCYSLLHSCIALLATAARSTIVAAKRTDRCVLRRYILTRVL